MRGCSLRRGYLVYKNVCKACHSVKYLAFREMVGVFMTEEEAKAEAEEVCTSFICIIDKEDQIPTYIHGIYYLLS